MVYNSIYGDLLDETFEYDISAEEIREMFGDVNLEQVLTEAAGFNISNVLSKMGIQSGSISKINTSLANTSKKIATEIKTNGINKETKKSISAAVTDFMDKLADVLVGQINDPTLKSDKYDKNKILKACVLTLDSALFLGLIQGILMIIITPGPANVVTACLCGPVCEEFCKRAAIKGDFMVEYTVVFNLFEFSSYMLQYGFMYKLSKLAIVRAMSVGMHLTNTFINFIANNEKFQKMIGCEGEEGKKKASFIGVLTSTLIHVCWNAMGYISSSPLAKAVEAISS